jgi:hypothetical protein
VDQPISCFQICHIGQNCSESPVTSHWCQPGRPHKELRQRGWYSGEEECLCAECTVVLTDCACETNVLRRIGEKPRCDVDDPLRSDHQCGSSSKENGYKIWRFFRLFLGVLFSLNSVGLFYNANDGQDVVGCNTSLASSTLRFRIDRPQVIIVLLHIVFILTSKTGYSSVCGWNGCLRDRIPLVLLWRSPC